MQHKHRTSLLLHPSDLKSIFCRTVSSNPSVTSKKVHFMLQFRSNKRLRLYQVYLFSSSGQSSDRHAQLGQLPGILLQPFGHIQLQVLGGGGREGNSHYQNQVKLEIHVNKTKLIFSTTAPLSRYLYIGSRNAVSFVVSMAGCITFIECGGRLIAPGLKIWTIGWYTGLLRPVQ